MLLPPPRGPLSALVHDALRHDDPSLPLPGAPATVVPDGIDPITDEDLQLALWTMFELHYRGFDDVADAWEWHADLIGLRTRLEDAFLAALRRDVAVPVARARSVPDRLRDLVDGDDGPSLSRALQLDADRAQFAEWAVHKSIYQLKEADPHTWGIPRLSGPVKAALVQVQVDEYGGGDTDRVHAELFRKTLRHLALDDSYGAYVPVVPGVTLAMSNCMSLFGLRRALRGALLGHLAAYEMTSSEPCARYAKGLRRLGGDQAACDFFDEHVTADALHEQLAAHDLCGRFADDTPALAEDILFGAAACLHLDQLFARHVLGAWTHGRPSLRDAAPDGHDVERRLPALRCEPSHNGLRAERPHRHNATLRSLTSNRPSTSSTTKSPRTTNGPSG